MAISVGSIARRLFIFHGTPSLFSACASQRATGSPHLSGASLGHSWRDGGRGRSDMTFVYSLPLGSNIVSSARHCRSFPVSMAWGLLLWMICIVLSNLALYKDQLMIEL